MWKWTRKHENKPVPPTPSAAAPVRNIQSRESVQAVPTLQSVESFRPDVKHTSESRSWLRVTFPDVGMSFLTANSKAASSYPTVALLSGLTDVSAPTR